MFSEEALSKQGENQFDQVKIAEQITEVKILKNTPKTLKVGKLTWNYKDNYELKINVKRIILPDINNIVTKLYNKYKKEYENKYILTVLHFRGGDFEKFDNSMFRVLQPFYYLIKIQKLIEELIKNGTIVKCCDRTIR